MTSPPLPQKILISPAIIDALKVQRSRTGVSARGLLKNYKGKIPAGLNPEKINAWIRGQTHSARKDHLSWVLEAWQALPDEGENYVELNPKNRNRLKDKIQATGQSPKRLLAKRNDLPQGFQWKHLHFMLNPKVKRMKKTHYRYIEKVCEENKAQGYVEITEELRAQIRREIERTGIRVPHLLRRAARENTPPVTAQTVNNWLNGRVKRADKESVHYVLGHYKKTRSQV